jgi:hypothetical protein
MERTPVLNALPKGVCALARRLLDGGADLIRNSRDFLARIARLILLPHRMLLNVIEKTEAEVGREIMPGWSRSAGYWFLRQTLRLAHWVVFWAVAGPIVM